VTRRVSSGTRRGSGRRPRPRAPVGRASSPGGGSGSSAGGRLLVGRSSGSVGPPRRPSVPLGLVGRLVRLCVVPGGGGHRAARARRPGRPRPRWGEDRSRRARGTRTAPRPRAAARRRPPTSWRAGSRRRPGRSRGARARTRPTLAAGVADPDGEGELGGVADVPGVLVLLARAGLARLGRPMSARVPVPAATTSASACVVVRATLGWVAAPQRPSSCSSRCSGRASRSSSLQARGSRAWFGHGDDLRGDLDPLSLRVPVISRMERAGQ
jgi:hypothetical protein